MVNLPNYQIILNKNTFYNFWVLTMQLMIGKEKKADLVCGFLFNKCTVDPLYPQVLHLLIQLMANGKLCFQSLSVGG